MTGPVQFSPEATDDIAEAYQWYWERSEAVSRKYLRALDTCVELLTAHPAAGPIIHQDVRRVLLRGFPYVLLYRITDVGVVVIACFHMRRDPRSWQDRL